MAGDGLPRTDDPHPPNGRRVRRAIRRWKELAPSSVDRHECSGRLGGIAFAHHRPRHTTRSEEDAVAEGPDPNRFSGTDRELQGEDERKGAGLGNAHSTRVWFPSWLSVAVLVLLVGLILFALLRTHQ
jgi:hypothetical protein